MTDSAMLEVETRVERGAGGDVAIVAARGEVDISNADELTAALSSQACSESDGTLLDLRELDFMDSSGLQAILVAAREADGRFAVVVTRDSAVAKLFEIVDVATRLNLDFDAEGALARVRAAGGDGEG